MSRLLISEAGVTLRQMVGSHFEISYDFHQLPKIDVRAERFILEVLPQNPLIYPEWLTPNGAGPQFINLCEGQSYRLRLHVTPHPLHQVFSDLPQMPHVDCFFEHEQLLRLVWGNIDVEALRAEVGEDQGEVWVDGKQLKNFWLMGQPELYLANRPSEIELRYGAGTLFSVSTNLNQSRVVLDLPFHVAPAEPRLHHSPCIIPGGGFQTRAELLRFYDMDAWIRQETQILGFQPSAKLMAGLQFLEDGKPVRLVRLWGYGFQVDPALVQRMQTKEMGLQVAQGVNYYELHLQITSAHREMHRYSLATKQFTSLPPDQLLHFTPAEVDQAKTRLAQEWPLVDADQAYWEVVAFFQVADRPLQEFGRANAYCYRWEHRPEQEVHQVEVQFQVWELGAEDQAQKILQGPNAFQDLFPAKVILKPFTDQELLVWWDLNPKAIRDLIYQQWHCTLEEVGFYLKFHEEFLGQRKPRPDLDARIIDLFTPWQNIYVRTQPNCTLSVEILARHFDKEMALTPVSPALVTPKAEGQIAGDPAPQGHLNAHWGHPSQREVRHAHGHDTQNQAKVMIHLHMHSPNLFRAEQFRESYIKPKVWPIRTQSGDEVHNTPGEWALKNCFDAWLPLLKMFRKLVSEGVDFQVSLDITPPVAYMISHPRFKDYFSRYLLRMKEHAKATLALMKSRLEAPEWVWAGQRHLDQILEIENFYHNDIHKDMIGAFRWLEHSGFLELSTCTATHGMPANLETIPASLNAQIGLAALSHQRIFGLYPKGIWLAENSCFPGIEKYLASRGLHYYFTEAEAVLQADKRPNEDEFNPLLSPDEPVVAFGRSRMGRVQVWDAEIGYAGHPDFREYHHRHWGLPLKRITSKTSWSKSPYNPQWAVARAQEMGQDFYNKLCGKADELRRRHLKAFPLITCSYDAELFGHHWYEGPHFLEELLREFHRKSSHIGLTTPSHYLAQYKDLPQARPNPSTWGHEAQHSRWNDPQVAWTQRELERADGLQRHYLKLCLEGELQGFYQACVIQMGRELLRATSSDLTFVIMSGDFVEDMRREILKYLDYFYRLKSLVDNRETDQDFLDFRQFENDMFVEMGQYYGLKQ